MNDRMAMTQQRTFRSEAMCLWFKPCTSKEPALISTNAQFPQVHERVETGPLPLFGLCSLLRVPKADQGRTTTVTCRLPNKADQGTKSR